MNAVRLAGLSTLVFVLSCGGEETPNAATNAPASPGTANSNGEPPNAGPDGSAPAPSPPPAPTCQGKATLAGDYDWTVTERIVHVHVPPSYDPAKGVPVVLDFHGYTSTGLQQAAYAGMNSKSDAAGFIAVHPEGTGAAQSWNAGVCCGTAIALGTKDVELVASILDELEAKLCVDGKRIFATGLSNGAFLSHRLACELSGRIAAIAPVAGVVGVPTCTPTRPVPVMQFHGTADTLVPYYGNPATGFPAVSTTIEGWAARNGCTDAPAVSFEKDDVRCMKQSQCSNGAEVTLCTVDAGGHTWPGSSIPIPSLGKTTQAINATDAMWEFFSKHPLP